MRLSLFSNAYETIPEIVECSWAELVEILGPHEFTRADKNDSPAFSPAEYASGTVQKLAANVLQLHLFVLDVDKASEEQVLAVCQTLGDLGLAAVVYTSWSHATKPWSVRIVVPLSQPVLASEWAEFWPRANAIFENIGDPKCKNVDRIYYRPFAPVGTEDQHFRLVFEGDELDVVAVTAMDLPVVPGQQSKLLFNAFERYALTLSRSKDDHKAEMGAMLKLVCKGEEFAKPGSRDDTVFRIACMLGVRFYDYDADSIAQHFLLSLQLMEKISPGCPTVKDVAYKIRRQQEIVAKEKSKSVEDVQDRIREAWGGDRTEPYTVEEITSFGDKIKRRLIVQYQGSFYVFFNGVYKGPYTEKEFLNAVTRELAPAKTLGVDLFRMNKQGDTIQKSINQLVQQYGTVAEAVVIDMTAQKTVYNEETRVIVEAPCPLRKITPKFHPEVDRWLQLFGGAKYEVLKTWIAALVRLDHPCKCLIVTGPKSVGKGMIALSSARVYSTNGPTSLADVFSDFNSGLAASPVCFADEQLPKDYKGHNKSAELREHIQATQRSFRRKFLPNVSLHGATRTIVAANNEDVLAMTQENITKNDMLAVGDRYLHIRVPKEAAEYLASIDTTGWVDNDFVTEHFMWLIKFHPWVAKGRWLIEDDSVDVVRSMATRDGIMSAVCEWLVGYLKDPGKFHKDGRSDRLVFKKNGKLFVNVQALSRCWGQYVTNEHCPTTGRLSIALACLSEEERLRYPDKQGRRTNFRQVDVEYLLRWVDDKGVWDREGILAALAEDTPEAEEKKATDKPN